MSNLYDAIIIGAGLNGLTTAAYLAKAGKRVLVIERRENLGGSVATEEIFKGFHFDTVQHNPGWINPQIIADLELDQHGLKVSTSESTVFAPTLEGDSLVLWADVERTAEEIRRFSEADANKWPDFVRLIGKLSGYLSEVYTTTMPSSVDMSPKEMLSLAPLGLKLKQMGNADMLDFIRSIPMSIAELLDDWFESDLLKGTLAASGITNIMQGPMAAGTSFVFLHHHVGTTGGIRPTTFVKGGAGNLSEALWKSARRYGADIRRGMEVSEIIVKSGLPKGVVISDGREFKSPVVISSLDPTTTFLRLLDPAHLGMDFIRKVQTIKYRGAFAKVNLALDKLPSFIALRGDRTHLAGLISISPSIRYLERAFDDAKFGEISEYPYLEAVIPTINDPTLAPSGKHVMSIRMQYAPYKLNGGWSGERADALGDLVIDTLSEYAPDIRDLILHWQVLTPDDLAETYNLPEGNAYHGELTLDQTLFMRPIPGYAGYHTPLPNLYMCGGGTHPGGGIAGASGFNAAREILKGMS